MRNVYFLLCSLLIIFFCKTNSNAQGSCADGAYQWSDIATIFQNNGCATATCHGGAASGLDLTTFAGFNTGGTKCGTEISSGTTLVDIIQIGGVACANGTVTNAMNNNIANPLSTADIDAIQAYIDGGSFEFCAGDPLDDGVCVPPSTIGSLADPGQTTLCSDGSDAITFTLPTASLPDVQIVIEINGVLTAISDDGSFDTSTLMAGDEVCYTAFTFDLAAINTLLETASALCPILDCDATFGIPGVNQAIDDLVNGVNDGVPGLNDLQEALDFAGSFGNPIGSVQTAGSTLDALNVQIGGLLGNVCYASAEAICLTVEECVFACTLTSGACNDCPADNLNISIDLTTGEAFNDGLELCADFGCGNPIMPPPNYDSATNTGTWTLPAGVVNAFAVGGVNNLTLSDEINGGCLTADLNIVSGTTPFTIEFRIENGTGAPGNGGQALTFDVAVGGTGMCSMGGDFSAGNALNGFAFTPGTVYSVVIAVVDFTGNPVTTDIVVDISNIQLSICVPDEAPVLGCTDANACNFDANATQDDGSCLPIPTCNTDICAGDTEIIDPNDACACIIDVVQVLGCTDDMADNYDAAANCDDGSCTFGPCEDMIAGSVTAEDIGCSVEGIEVTIYDSTGAVAGTAITDADGNYALMGVFPCGDYTAELTADIPTCYTNSGGTAGPIGFAVDGDGAADGANFIENPQVPTLSQWGLMILALLLMTFGALKLGFQQLVYLKPNS